MSVDMKKFEFIGLFILINILTCVGTFCQADVWNRFNPKQIDVFQNKMLLLGYDSNKGGVLSVFIRNLFDTTFSIENITEDVNLELNNSSNVHFDNHGNIWAFGRNNLWKYENEEWQEISFPNDLITNNRKFREFCFDDENNLFVIVYVEFERRRDTINGTIYVILDSVNSELLKINANNPTLSYEVIKKYNYKEQHDFGAIHAITKRPDGAIVCILAEESNNLMIYKDNQLSFQTIPINPDGFKVEVTSMEYDNHLNLWYSVRTSSPNTELLLSNGVHKFTNTGTHLLWDSSFGLNGKLFQKNRPEPTLSVHNISINQSTGLVWGGTDYGFFSIDESKPLRNQLTFYSRDSLINPQFRYFPTKVSIGKPNEFEFVTIVQYENKSFFASQKGFLEMVGKDTPSSVGNLDVSLTNSIDIYPLPSSTSEVFVAIKNNVFVNGSTLSIVDMSGRTLQLIQIESATGNIQIPVNTKNFASGTYYAILRSGNNTISKQFIVVN